MHAAVVVWRCDEGGADVRDVVRLGARVAVPHGGSGEGIGHVVCLALDPLDCEGIASYLFPQPYQSGVADVVHLLLEDADEGAMVCGDGEVGGAG